MGIDWGRYSEALRAIYNKGEDIRYMLGGGTLQYDGGIAWGRYGEAFKAIYDKLEEVRQALNTELLKYLLLDGSRAMKGNFDLDVYALLTKNFAIIESEGQIQVKNRLLTEFRDIRIRDITCELVLGYVPTYPIPIHAEGSRYGYDKTYGVVSIEIVNMDPANIANAASFVFRLQTSTKIRNVGSFAGYFDPITDATRTSHIALYGANLGTYAPRLQVDGDEVTFPDLAGVGNAYLYVDANGKLCRGASYP